MIKKYVLISGGIISGIGKGIIASSTGLLLKTMGLKVTSIKIDPYLNIDAGTMSPLDHGEVFILNDGGEVDLDLGNYERYLDVTLSRENNITTGKIYRDVIERERKGDYLGKTVQVVPHITDAIQEWVERVATIPVDDSAEEPDVCIIELGGTVGDIESAPFVEAMRQFQFRVGHENFALIHVSLVPTIGAVGEQKTKPTQASIRDLRGLGLTPDLIATRCEKTGLEEGIRSKISMFCHVQPEQVLAVRDCSSVYHVPELLKEQGLIDYLWKRLSIEQTVSISPALKEKGEVMWQKWNQLTASQERLQDSDSVTIALVGKYTHLQDSYASVVKALEHASLACHKKLVIKWIEGSDLEPEIQVANPSKYNDSWATLRAAQANTENCAIRKLYGGEATVLERHRHRYEVNPELVGQFEAKGLSFVGKDETGQRMEIVEIADHPYFVGVQYHPELLTRPLKPSPPFMGLIMAAAGELEKHLASL
ncbi:CTP synthase ura7 [Podila clonocystis]|nr:CTP synthase ura7 [Podila clonocystis]